MDEFDTNAAILLESATSPPSSSSSFNITTTSSNNVSTQMMNASSDEDDDQQKMLPPEHLFSDYIEIAYLGAVIIAGLALNFCVLKRLLREKRQEERGGRPKNGFVLLKLNLNISDLLILLIHATGKLGWLITYEWRGGEHLCRLFNFLSMFTLYLSSNIVICIALDRLITVLKAQKINTGKRKLNLVRLMVALAWTFSILFSLPQLFVWTTYNPFKLSNSTGWIQCTDIWSIDRYERYLEEHSDRGKPGDTGKGQSALRNGWTQFVLSTAAQNIYELAHLFLVFYGPLIVLVFCYALISTRLIRFAANNPRNSSQQPTSQENGGGGGGGHTSSVAESRQQQYCKRASIKSFPAVKLYAPLADRKRRRSHHQVPMIDIHEVSTRAEETSLADQASSQKNSYAGQNGEVDCAPLMNGQHRPSNNSLPIYGLQPDRHEVVGDDFLGKAILVRCSVPNCNTTLPLHNCSSNSSLSTAAALQPNKKSKRILLRLRDSFRDSISRRLNRPRGHRLNANLALHCSSVASLSGGDHQSQQKKHFPWWNICQQFANGGHICCWREDQHEGTPHQNGCRRQQQPDWLCRQSTINQSVRSSLSTSATVGPIAASRNGGERRGGGALPLWRRHLRSRAFRATLLVILAHVLLWSPYNVYALMKHVNQRLYERMSEQANVLKDLQFLIVLINPFLYGFGRKVQGRKKAGGGGGGTPMERTAGGAGL